MSTQAASFFTNSSSAGVNAAGDILFFVFITLLEMASAPHLSVVQPTASNISLFAVGAIAFNMTEYIVHRFGMHKAPIPRTVYYFIHGHHHRRPNDNHLLVPNAIKLATYTMIYFALRILGFSSAVGFWTDLGVTFGCHAFHLVHWNIHRGTFLKRAFPAIVAFHNMHHRYPGKAFAFTSPAMDLAFNTAPSKEHGFSYNFLSLIPLPFVGMLGVRYDQPPLQEADSLIRSHDFIDSQ